MGHLFQFGENIQGYDIPVLNEREARAGAGILLLPAVVSFMNAYLTHNFIFTKIFVTFFMLDFFIRIFINPKYAPSLILGRLVVANQSPEYVGAPQKRFAWFIGFLLAVVMFFIIVIFEIMTPIKIAICLLCILLLFSETAFGICIGCILYHKLYSIHTQYCPGNICEVKKREKIQMVDKIQMTILFFSILIIATISITMDQNRTLEENKSVMKCGLGKCNSGK